MKQVVFLLMLCLGGNTLSAEIPLTPNDVTCLIEGQAYTINEADAQYTLTTEGVAVKATLNVKTTATLILDNCHILNQGKSASDIPITISEPGVTLTIIPSGSNSLAINSESQPYSAIYAKQGYAAKLIFAEKRNATIGDTLFIRGCSTSSTKASPQCTPPINLSEAGSVTFRSGNITLAAAEANTLTPTGNYKTLPSLVSTGHLALQGGQLTVQLCPRSTTGVLNGEQLSSGNYNAPLFTCTSFQMTGGTLTTAGERCLSKNVALKATTTAYDTCYLYPQTPFEALTPAETPQAITAGARIGYHSATFYGFPPHATLPPATFSYEGTNDLPQQTADENGTVTLNSGTRSYPNLTLNYVKNTPSAAYAAIFGAPPIPTEDGLLARATFGTTHLSFNETPLLTFSLHLPDEQKASEKSFLVEVIEGAPSGSTRTLFRGLMTFSRSDLTAPFIAPVFSCPAPLEAYGCTRYTIRAYN